MALPTQRTVTGLYTHPVTGAPQTGSVVFAPYPAFWTDDTGAQIMAGELEVTLSSGAYSQPLVVSATSSVLPAVGKLWKYTEKIDGESHRVSFFELPDGVGPIDITDLILVDPTSPPYTPGGAAGGDLTGNYPNPQLANTSTARSHLGLGTAATRNVGTTAGTVAAGDDSRFAAAADALQKAQNLADLPDPSVARDSLGLGDSATKDTGTGAGQVAAGDDSRILGAAQKSANLTDLANPGLARTALGLGNSATRNVGNTGGTVAAGDDPRFTTAKPWVFDVTSYGALGNGQTVSDGAMTNGSPTLTCATSAPFVVGDVGKSIQVLNAGASNETLVGTISAYISATQVTLSVSAGSTVSGMPVLWASDDTAAFQAAVDAAVAYALLHAYAATVLVPAATKAFYGISGALKTGGGTLGNAQIALPVVPTTGRKLTLSIQGAHSGAGVQHWQQLTPNTTGSTLVSFGLFANSTAQTNSINAAGNPAVIGGPSQPGGYGVAPGVFSNVYVDIADLSILTCHSKFGFTYTGIDLSGVANCQLRDLQVSTSGTVAPPAGSYVSPGVFATGLAIGILLPANGNNDLTIIRNLTIGGGYTYGILATEHTDIHGMRILYCWAAFCPVGSYYSSVGAAHSIHGTLVSIEQCTYLIYIFGPGTGGLGPTMYLKIDTETSTPRFGDRTSGTGLAAARGEVTLAGLFTPSGLTLDAPTGLRIRNSQLTYPVTVKTANYTATSFDQDILVDATSGPVTINLPTAVGRTDPITVKKTDASSNAVTIDGAGSETIDGALTRVLSAQWDHATLLPSGSAWFVRSNSVATPFLPLAGGTMTGTKNATLGGAGSTVDASLVSGDAFDRFRRYADGKLEWGPGNATRDTNLYRDAVDSLRTDDNLTIVGATRTLGWLTYRRRDLPDMLTVDSLYSGTAPVISTAQTTTPQTGFIKYAPAGVALSGSDVTGPFSYAGAGSFAIGAVSPDTNYVLPLSKYPNTYASGQSTWSVEFGTDAQTIQVRFKHINSATMYRMTVDGRKVTDLMQSAGGITPGSGHLITIDFGSAASRRIRFDFSTFPFGGVYIPPTATLWGVALNGGGRFMTFTDSIGDGSGQNTGAGCGTWVDRVGRMMGATDVWRQGRGGTGYITAGSYATFGTRVAADVIAWNPNRLIIWGGYNDSSGLQSDILTAANSLFSTIKAGLPFCEVFVMGCWSPSGSPGSTLTNTDATLRTAAATAGYPFISPITGSVYNSAGTLVNTHGAFITAANTAAYIGGDAVHPNDAGHIYLARRIKTAIEDLMPA